MADIISLTDARASRAAAKPPADNAAAEEVPISVLIRQLADTLGIDVEAPFRRKPK